MKRAVILLSGGLDSTTILYYAQDKGFKTYCLIFSYGQRHVKEVQKAKRIATKTKSSYQVAKIQLPWQGSSLLDKTKKLPRHKKINPKVIPSTYVPARNIIFLSFASSYAEAIGAQAIFIGVNAIDYSGYPDCRPKFYEAYQLALKRGMKSGVQGRGIKIYTPLIKKTKSEIVGLGQRLNVPFHLTWSCYQGGQRPCGICDSCVLRKNGFEEAGLKDRIE